MLSLSGDESFLDLFPGTNPRMPDLEVGWSSINCWIGTIQNTIPFNSVLWSLFRAPAYGSRNSLDSSPVGSGGTVPLRDAPGIDLIPILTGDVKPIFETYHRLMKTINPNLLHR